MKNPKEMSTQELLEEIKKEPEYEIKANRLMAGTPQNVEEWIRNNQGWHFEPNVRIIELK